MEENEHENESAVGVIDDTWGMYWAMVGVTVVVLMLIAAEFGLI